MTPRDRARPLAKKLLDASAVLDRDDALLDWAIDVVLDIQREARREAMERAAEVCDDEVRRGKADSRRSDTNPQAAFQSGAAKCAWRIRALIDKPAREGK